MTIDLFSRNLASDQNVYVSSSRFGRGIFAARDFDPGQIMIEFKGPRIPFSVVLEVEDGRGNPLQIGPDLFINLESPSSMGNHSCDPNAGVFADPEEDRYWLVARKPVLKGEEIYYDYSTTIHDDFWTMPCDCREPRCRGEIGEFKDLPAEVKEEYIREGIVLPFILKGLAMEAGKA